MLEQGVRECSIGLNVSANEKNAQPERSKKGLKRRDKIMNDSTSEDSELHRNKESDNSLISGDIVSAKSSKPRKSVND